MIDTIRDICELCDEDILSFFAKRILNVVEKWALVKQDFLPLEEKESQVGHR